MASEAKRGCGYRKVGGTYLVSEGIWVGCDRIPYELKSCPVCGAGIHLSRAMTEIDPLKLFGKHDRPSLNLNTETTPVVVCQDEFRPCKMCDPTSDPAYIMLVGRAHYTPEEFIREAQTMGISKRIAQIPKKLKLGQTVVYLAHPDGIITEVEETHDKKGNPYLTPKMVKQSRLAIIGAFTPQRVEMPVWEKQLSGKGSRKFKATLKKRGITPVVVKGKEHDPKYKPRKVKA